MLIDCKSYMISARVYPHRPDYTPPWIWWGIVWACGVYSGSSQSIPWGIVWELPDYTWGIVQPIPGYSPVRGVNLGGYTGTRYLYLNVMLLMIQNVNWQCSGGGHLGFMRELSFLIKKLCQKLVSRGQFSWKSGIIHISRAESEKVTFPLRLLAAILKNVNNWNCPRVTPPHPLDSLSGGSWQQYSAKKKTIYSKSRLEQNMGLGCRTINWNIGYQ